MYAHGIFGAAYYSTGDFALGNKFFDRVIERTTDVEMPDLFKKEKQELRELYEAKQGQPTILHNQLCLEMNWRTANVTE